jgi:hypothetical protein
VRTRSLAKDLVAQRISRHRLPVDTDMFGGLGTPEVPDLGLSKGAIGINQAHSPATLPRGACPCSSPRAQRVACEQAPVPALDARVRAFKPSNASRRVSVPVLVLPSLRARRCAAGPAGRPRPARQRVT